MRLLLIGHGRMGKLVEALASEYGAEVAGVLDAAGNAQGGGIATARWGSVDVAIDFSTASAVEDNVLQLANAGINAVVGTTGWDAAMPRVRDAVERSGIGVVVAPNFSTGAIFFAEIVKRAATLMGSRDEYGAWLHELHHAGKRDAPSGTALALQRAIAGAGYPRTVDIASTRAGHLPGTHAVGFDGPSDTIELTHVVRDRGTFARGALVAAQWVRGRRGWYTMHDCLGITGEKKIRDQGSEVRGQGSEGSVTVGDSR